MQQSKMSRVKSESNFASVSRLGRPADDLLHREYKKRQDALEEKRRVLAELEEEQIKAAKPPASQQSVLYATSKFEKEYAQAVLQIFEGTEGPISESRTMLNYMKLQQVMTEMGYIP